MKNRILFLSLFLALSMCPPLTAAAIYTLHIDGTINPVVADYIENGIDRAGREGADALIIKMDTPGGLMESMRQIIKSMESAPFPIIVYVGDSGARAASAGAFITLASDIAVMAKGTNIGAAHPVQLGEGKVTEDMSKKMSEDARAFIKSIAEKHNRNAEWAQKAVTDSVSITANEALSMNVIEYRVDDFSKLLEVLEGLKVTKNNKEYTISFKEGVTRLSMPVFKRLLNHIANPNLAYILLMIGVYGLIYEFSNPGVGLGAVVGGTSLLLAFLAFQMIPVNVVGVLLILFGVILMIMDIWVPSYGILTIGGVTCVAIGSFTLYDFDKFPVELSIGLVLGAVITLGLFFIFVAGAGIKIQSKKVSTGQQGMIGLTGDVRRTVSGKGEVFVRGELWEARSEGGAVIPEGAQIEVMSIEGNCLTVKEENQKEG